MLSKSLLLCALLAGVSYVPGCFACKCAQPDFCDVLSDDANIVLRGTTLSREVGDTEYDDVTYVVEVAELFNGSPSLDKPYPQTLTFLTVGDTAACGVYLELDEDYLVHVYFDDDEGVYRSKNCGLTRKWSRLTNKQKRTLRTGYGCDDDDDSY